MPHQTLLFRQVDQDDIGVLPRTVEHKVFPVRRDVEGIQVAAIAEVSEVTDLLRGEIDKPEVLGFDPGR